MSVLVIGGSVAGIAVADGLRSQGYQGAVTVVDADPSLPYDKPPLSKHALKEDWDPIKGLLRPEEHYAAKDIELVTGRTAVALDAVRRTVRFDDGSERQADHVVLATGVRARLLPEELMLPGVHAIRTAADSAAVRAALADRPRLVVIGGGFIGAEAASVAAGMGLEVTIVEALPLPFQHLFGADVAEAMAGWHRAAGVRLECGVMVAGIEGAERVERVRLTDGRVLEVDLVLLGLGAVPAVDWLDGSGLDLDNGITCDEDGRTGLPGIWAAGDAATWRNPVTGDHVRVEHWTTAKEQGAAVAHNIARPDEPARGAGPVPYFWSDQHGLRVQFLGTSAGHDATHLVHGSFDEPEFVVLYAREGRIIGALGVAAARHVMKYRTAISAGERIEGLLDPVGEAAGA
ncbi:NAD(P)/FAD-dependent oxidoreductase [Nocardioides jensenii]|uniref:NAD(P)/FAD-dependent oxidoreductase n=1 Tax=Nocardioides jensenii TaxID=1843 RepID=UPI000832FDDE|nr:FAD-dependent oxidoreductase [Nocardioides jensenii]